MPNWVRNHVKFGTDKVIKDCITNKRGVSEFDFDKVIPMPDVLNEDDGLDKMTMEERLLFLRENRNCDNWYDWCVEFWGTKWNANETIVLNDKEVWFDTAWSMPEPIFEEISRKYHTTVKVAYADEGIIENSGIVLYKDGEEVARSDGNKRLCAKIWNWDDEGK